MSGKAAKITCTEKQKSILERIGRSTTVSTRLVQRVGVILMAFTGSLNSISRSPSNSAWHDSKSASGDGGGSSPSTRW